MADAAILENFGNAVACLPKDQFRQNFSGRISSRLRHVCRDAVSMVTAVA